MSETILKKQPFEKIIAAMKKHYKFFSNKEFITDYTLGIDSKLPPEIVSEVDKFSKEILEYTYKEKLNLLKHSLNFINETISYNEIIKILNESQLLVKNMANKITDKYLEKMKEAGLNYPNFQQNIVDIANSNVIFFLQIVSSISDFFFNVAVKLNDVISTIQIDIDSFFANIIQAIEKYFHLNFELNISHLNIIHNEPILSD